MRALRALLPAPGLSALVLALWLLLARPPSTAQLLLGLALALVVPRLFPLLRMPPVRLRNPRRVLGYMRVVAGDVVASNIEVGIGLFRGGARAPKPSFVVIPLDLRDPVGLAVLAMVTTIVPGTVWSELALDRSTLLLHVWDVPDETAFVARYKARYEQPLCEIFE